MTEAYVVSHWHHLVENFQFATTDFYSLIDQSIKKRLLTKCDIDRITIREGGIFSASREYLRVTSQGYIFDICAAPYGTGFFVSWRLGEIPAGLLTTIPYIGWIFRIFVKPSTYYKIDIALMFQQSIHNAVLETLDGVTQTKGIRALSETERKPILRDFFGR